MNKLEKKHGQHTNCITRILIDRQRVSELTGIDIAPKMDSGRITEQIEKLRKLQK